MWLHFCLLLLSHGGGKRAETERCSPERLTLAAVLFSCCCWETDVNAQKDILPVSCHTIKVCVGGG